MQIRVTRNSVCGAIEVPAGEYLVAVSADGRQIKLTGHGLDIALPAVRRKAQGKGRVDSVTFFNGGGKTWSIVVNLPKQGEWVAMVEATSGGSPTGILPSDLK